MRPAKPNRSAFTVVEFTVVGAVMTSIVVAASAIWTGLLRPMSGEIVELRLSQEAKLVAESLKHDLSGSNPDLLLGMKDEGRLVGARVNSGALELCFDGAPENSAADWASPDIVVNYSLDSSQFVRTNLSNGQATPIASDVDSFKASESLVTVDLVELRDQLNLLDFERQGTGMFRQFMFHESMLDATRRLVDAVANALSLRIRRDGRQEQHDWAVDMRGGLTQVIHSASVPMVCGVSLLKWCLRSRFTAIEEGKEERQRPIGVVTKLTFYRAARFRRIELYERQNSILGVFDFSIGHMFNPTEFVDYFDSSAKMILRAWDEIEPILVESTIASAEPEFKRLNDRDEQVRAELFSKLFTLCFVFGCDWRLALKHILTSYNLRPQPLGNDVSLAADEYLSRMLQLFIVTSFFRQATPTENPPEDNPGDWPLVHPWSCRSNNAPTVDVCFVEYVKFLEQAAPYCAFFPYIRRSRIEAQDGRFQVKFAHDFQAHMTLFDDVWWRVVRLYRGCLFANQRNSTLSRKDLLHVFRECLSTGNTDIWSRLSACGVLDVGGVLSEDEEVGIVLHLLAAYTFLEYSPVVASDRAGEQMELGDRISFFESESSAPYFDRRYPRARFSGGIQRGIRFRRDIALHRILWDLSTRIRARSIQQLVQQPDISPTESKASELSVERARPEQFDQFGMLSERSSELPPNRPR